MLLHVPLFLRTLRKEVEIYGLKIITLSIAFACALVVVLFCWNEFTYDRFHDRSEELFRVLLKNERYDFEGNRFTDRIPPVVYRKFSDPKTPVIFSRCKVLEQQTVQARDRKFNDVILHAADTTIASVFSFSILSGSMDEYRKNPSSVLLSERQATSFFETTECIGKAFFVIAAEDTIAFHIAAVYRDFPVNSHEPFDCFIQYDSATLKKLSVDPKDAGLYGHLKQFHPATEIERLINDRTLKADTSIHYKIQPLAEIYFGRRVIGESAMHGDRYSILILIFIASLITLLAITNYINLTTLTLPNRSGEIAIRKVAGASQLRVLAGFAIESGIITLFSLLLAVLILITTRHSISAMLPMDMLLFFQTEKNIVAAVVVLLLASTIIGPLFIALRFVKTSPSKLFSTERITFPRFKRIITVLQLGTSLSLIVAGIVVTRQISYSLVKEPGRNKDQIVYLPYPPGMTERELNAIRVGWKQNNPNIEGVTAVSHLPDQITRKKINSAFYSLIVGSDFPEFFKYPMVKGRWFGPNDTVAAVVNQRGAEIAEATATPVIGVIADLGGIYNQSEKPVMIERGTSNDFNYLCIRIIEVDVRETVAYLERRFDLRPGQVKFIDRKFETWMVYEDHLGALCGMLAIVSGLMAGCAIYGLSLSLGNDKIKQVAIHKMLGASFPDIIGLLMNTFAMPLLVAALVFGLVTYIALSEWLRNFIYKTHLGLAEVLAALGFCLVIISLTSLRQAAKLTGASLIQWLKS